MSQGGFASPGPAGLGALAVVCAGFGASFCGWVKPEGMPILAAWLFGGFVVQLVTAIIELREGNMTGGNVMLFFASFFMLASALGLVAKFIMFTMKMSLAPTVLVEGYFWAAAAAFLTIVTPAYARQNAIMFFLVVVVDVILWTIAGIDLGLLPATVRPLLGYALFGVGFVGIYMSGAALVNTVYGKAIFWIPPSILQQKQPPSQSA